MKVNLVGTLKNVVDKTGAYPDPSGQWDVKSFDAGGGQEKP
jgi:hypothetical protein